MAEFNLIVMIPAFNEQETIAGVVSSIPRIVEKVSTVKILIIDDGSTDATVERAQKAGADFIFRHPHNLGLAHSFAHGLEEAVRLGADIVVNLDADGQYEAGEIARLVAPIVAGSADIVLGDRQVARLAFMPAVKKYGNMLGSFLVRQLSGAAIHDASSGFRAYNSEAALRLNILSAHTYTHESIIDAAAKGLRMAQIPVTFRPTQRAGGKSRLIESLWQHIKDSLMIIIRTFVLYRPLKAFFYAGLLFVVSAALIGVRFVYYYANGAGQGKIQSLILAAALAIVGFQIIIMGFLADASNANRKISEEILFRLKKASKS